MQSSSKVLKAAVVHEEKLVAPPVIEKLFEKSQGSVEPEFNIEEIYEKITREAMNSKNEIIKKAEEKAKEIVNSALNEGNKIKASSKEEGHQQGFRKGYEEGYNFGMKEAEKAAETMIKDADTYVKSCHEASRKYIEDVEKEIIGLSIDIARKIINAELTLNTEAIYKMAEGILSKAMDKRQIIMKVNPGDFSLVKNRKDDLSIYVEDSNNLIIIADPAIKQGSLQAETPSGFIDGDIDTQLEIIFKSLTEG